MDCDVLMDYCDGTDFHSHPLFSVCRTGLQIQLYYDDVELCNPLGSSRTKHKVGKISILSLCTFRFLYVHDNWF